MVKLEGPKSISPITRKLTNKGEGILLIFYKVGKPGVICSPRKCVWKIQNRDKFDRRARSSSPIYPSSQQSCSRALYSVYVAWVREHPELRNLPNRRIKSTRFTSGTMYLTPQSVALPNRTESVLRNTCAREKS